MWHSSTSNPYQNATEAAVHFSTRNKSTLSTAPGNHSAASLHVAAKLQPATHPRIAHTLGTLPISSPGQNDIAQRTPQNPKSPSTPVQPTLLPKWLVLDDDDDDIMIMTMMMMMMMLMMMMMMMM